VSEDRMAPKGAIWVCGACGKTSIDRYGTVGWHDTGWDESCMLNAVLCEEGTLIRANNGFGHVIKGEPFKPTQTTALHQEGK